MIQSVELSRVDISALLRIVGSRKGADFDAIVVFEQRRVVVIAAGLAFGLIQGIGFGMRTDVILNLVPFTLALFVNADASRARLVSASISVRSTPEVESRSSQKANGTSRRARMFWASDRADWTRGPSDPSMLSGRPITKPAHFRSS